jgi:transcription factor WhiB
VTTLSFLMPCPSPRPDGVTPQREVPGRRCAPFLNGGQPPVTGPVLLGWPVLTSCPAKTHNTLHAAREYPRGQRCVCPGAVAKKAEHLRRQEGKRAERRRRQVASGRPRSDRARRNPVRVSAVLAVVSAATQEHLTSTGPVPLMPACKVDTLGGSITPTQADDFYDETRSRIGDRARDRAKAICHRCPVQAACLTGAVERGEAWGVWGGLSPEERRDPRLVARELRSVGGWS